MKEVRKEQLERQRKGLLALVHLAKKDLGLSEEIYRSALAAYGVGSAAAMSIQELTDLVQHFENLGFKRKVVERRKADRTRRQARALQLRAMAEAEQLERDGEKRLQGLVRKICGVDRLDWCRDPGKLERLLAAMRKIRNSELN